MTSPLALFRSGANGIEATPVDFANFTLPGSPNTCLAAPHGHPLPAHLRISPVPMGMEAAWAAIHRVADARPRCYPLYAWPERRQAQWVERSGLMNYPDIIVAQLLPGEGNTGLILYSRSLFGYSDLGANRRRVTEWLAVLDAQPPSR